MEYIIGTHSVCRLRKVLEEKEGTWKLLCDTDGDQGGVASNFPLSFILLVLNLSSRPRYLSRPDMSTALEMCSGYEAGSYVRLIDLCITQFQAGGSKRRREE